MSLAMQSAVAYVPHHSRPCHFEPDVVEFNESVLAPYDMRFDPSWTAGGTNLTFLDLAEGVLGAVQGPAPDPDLLILAYALPDPHGLEKTLAAHLNRVLGGRSMSFAVSEQGLGAPFTALRVAGAYLESGRCRSAALFILEQTSFPYPEPFVRDADLVDSAVLLTLGAEGGWKVTAAAPDEHAPDTLVVTGSWIGSGDTASDGPKVHRAPPGSYCTGVWLELARHAAEWAESYRTIVLRDTDPRTGVGHVATLTRCGP
jgi:hypothetical protein